MPAPSSTILNKYPQAHELLPRIVELLGFDVSALRHQDNHKRRLLWSGNAPMGEVTSLKACLDLAELITCFRCPSELLVWKLEQKGDVEKLLALRFHNWMRVYGMYGEMLNSPGAPGTLVRGMFTRIFFTTIVDLVVLARIWGSGAIRPPLGDGRAAAKELAAEIKRLNSKFALQQDRTLQRAVAGKKMDPSFCKELRKRLASRGFVVPETRYFDEFAVAQRFLSFGEWAEKNGLSFLSAPLGAVLLKIDKSTKEESLTAALGRMAGPTDHERNLIRLWQESEGRFESVPGDGTWDRTLRDETQHLREGFWQHLAQTLQDLVLPSGVAPTDGINDPWDTLGDTYKALATESFRAGCPVTPPAWILHASGAPDLAQRALEGLQGDSLLRQLGYIQVIDEDFSAACDSLRSIDEQNRGPDDWGMLAVAEFGAVCSVDDSPSTSKLCHARKVAEQAHRQGFPYALELLNARSEH